LLDQGDVARMRPFGQAPLAMERAAVLDAHFEELTVGPVSRGAGWARITTLPPLWDD
jgi:hypothetical protein